MYHVHVSVYLCIAAAHVHVHVSVYLCIAAAHVHVDVDIPVYSNSSCTMYM